MSGAQGAAQTGTGKQEKASAPHRDADELTAASARGASATTHPGSQASPATSKRRKVGSPSNRAVPLEYHTVDKHSNVKESSAAKFQEHTNHFLNIPFQPTPHGLIVSSHTITNPGPYGFRKWRATVDYDLPIGVEPLPVGAIPPPLVWWYDVAWRMGVPGNAQDMPGSPHTHSGNPPFMPHAGRGMVSLPAGANKADDRNAGAAGRAKAGMLAKHQVVPRRRPEASGPSSMDAIVAAAHAANGQVVVNKAISKSASARKPAAPKNSGKQPIACADLNEPPRKRANKSSQAHLAGAIVVGTADISAPTEATGTGPQAFDSACPATATPSSRSKAPSGSSVAAVAGDETMLGSHLKKRRKKVAVPESKKDAKYWERRRRNCEDARKVRSRKKEQRDEQGGSFTSTPDDLADE